MEASTRLIGSTSLTRHLLLHKPSPNLPLNLSSRALLPPQFIFQNPNPRNRSDPSSAGPPFPSSKSSPPLRRIGGRSVHFLSSSPPSSNPFGPLLSLSVSQILPSNFPHERLDCSESDPNEGFLLWDREKDVSDGGNLGFFREKGPIWTVVLLGWLGAEHKHLKRYAEIYNSIGIRSVRFVVPVKEVIGFDLGRRVEGKIEELARELVSWCSESEKDGRERHLLFHTFSNTGWLNYGSLLQNFQSRPDIIEKIRGCVIDSGAAAEISPQIWAAGFCAALLKKRSSLTYSSFESIEGGKLDGNSDGMNIQEIRPTLSEIIALSILEKIFSIVLILPDLNQRLSRMISILSKNQPPCPQLYLYSSSDKVIPAGSVECFIRKQKALGINVRAYDFGSSPHVDHFRSFPHLYSAKVNEFLKNCCFPTICQT